MGNVRKRGKVWYVDYYFEGRRVRKRVGPSKKLAQLTLKDIELRIARNELQIVKDDTRIEDFLQEYFDYSKENHSPNTHRRYKAVIDHFETFLSERHPQVIRLSHLNPHIFIEKA